MPDTPQEPERPEATPPAANDAERPPPTRLVHPRTGIPITLAARGVVALELGTWPSGDPKELDLAVERFAVQGRHFELPVERLIVALHELVERHARRGRPEWEVRPLRERVVRVLIQAYHRGTALDDDAP